MLKIKVALAELEVAFDNTSWEMSYYLDLETGEVVMVTDEIRRELEDIYAEIHGEGEAEQVAFDDALQRRDPQEADQVEASFGTRYVEAPRAESHEGYRDMEDFIAPLRDERLQDRLWDAIRGRGAFRRFKDELAYHPYERERWFEFKDDRVRKRVLNWLESEGIEPILE
ncbi:MAG: UPF0158 family protein [Anaerolineae bacterium]